MSINRHFLLITLLAVSTHVFAMDYIDEDEDNQPDYHDNDTYYTFGIEETDELADGFCTIL
jgi:hypothetical protein